MMKRTAIALVICALYGTAGSFVVSGAERVWQTGTWREVKVERPKVLFSVQPRDPNSNVPRAAAAREVRTYVIESDTLRLELRQDATVDTPTIDVLIGQPVTFALEKKTVYVRDEDGKEHKLSVRKQTALTPPHPKQ